MTTTDNPPRMSDLNELLCAIDAHVSSFWRTQETLTRQAGVVRSFMEALGASEATVDAVLDGDRAVFIAWHTRQMQDTD